MLSMGGAYLWEEIFCLWEEISQILITCYIILQKKPKSHAIIQLDGLGSHWISLLVPLSNMITWNKSLCFPRAFICNWLTVENRPPSSLVLPWPRLWPNSTDNNNNQIPVATWTNLTTSYFTSTFTEVTENRTLKIT